MHLSCDQWRGNGDITGEGESTGLGSLYCPSSEAQQLWWRAVIV
jgi:hypothetical protein